jgi:PEP-CTERM motif
VKLRVFALSALFAATGADAATITRTFQIDASDFTLDTGSGAPSPIDPVQLDFTISFDPTVSMGKTTEGLTINSFNLPYSSAFALDPGLLIVATDPFPDGCFNNKQTYCVTIDNPASAHPTANGFRQTTSSGGSWSAGAVTVTVVPEPSTWGLLLIGLGGLGLVHRSVRRGMVAV